MGNGVERTGGCNPAADGAKHFQMFSPVYGPAPPVWLTRDLSGTNTRRVSCPLLSAIELNLLCWNFICHFLRGNVCAAVICSESQRAGVCPRLEWFPKARQYALCAWLSVHLHLQGALNVSSLLSSSLHHRKALCRCRWDGDGEWGVFTFLVPGIIWANDVWLAAEWYMPSQNQVHKVTLRWTPPPHAVFLWDKAPDRHLFTG